MIASGINLVMTVIGFVVSTMFIVFVCTRLVCARIQLRASRRAFPMASRSDLSALERGLHGLEPVVVSNFPTKKYSDDLFLVSEDAQCTVCLADYHREDILRILPYCGHSFHVTCIDIWLQLHSTCPVCRISLREFPERKRVMQPLFSSAIRMHFGTESFNIHGCDCLMNEHMLSPENPGDSGINTLRDNQCVSVCDEADYGTENQHPVGGGNQVSKDLQNKQVESPSSR